MKDKIYNLLEKDGTRTRGHSFTSFFIVTLIILNTIAIMFESVPEIMAAYGTYLHAFDFFSVMVFTIEYFARIYISDKTHPSTSKIRSAFKFMFSIHGLIDLIAIIPFYIPLLITVDLREIRLLRIFRFFRLFKIHRYNSSLGIIWQVIKEKRMELILTCALAVVVMSISAVLIYHIEHPVQPEVFRDMRQAAWWAIATLTAVGYGDIYPITYMGKLIAGIVAFAGIGLVALPTGLISVGFLEKIRKQGKKEKKTVICPHCGKPVDEH